MTPRRRWLLGSAAAGLALGGGLGVRWWQARRDPSTHPLFSERFAGVDGPSIEMRALLGRPLVLNFWATWCPPCVRELPALDVFWRAQPADGWQVLGLAVDRAEAVREFLLRHPVGFPIGVVGFDGIAAARQLGNDTGGLPFSVLFDGKGHVRGQHAGELTADSLAAWIRRSGVR